MKNMRRVLAILLAAAMVMVLSVAAFAQDVDTQKGGSATITIKNAAKGETYKVAKLFDAVTSNAGVTYSGTIPTDLNAYFEVSGSTIKEKADLDFTKDDVQSAFKSWADSKVTAQAVSEGGDLVFKNLEYGYYIVTSTQGTKVTVDSTRPNAEIWDKNSTTPVSNLTKTADDKDVFIGQTVTYTVKFATSNYNGSGSDAKQIVSYTIKDTPAAGSLENITVTGIAVDEDGNAATTNDQTALSVQQFANNQITIPWAADGANLYKNGAYIILTYTAKVADTAAIDGAGNTNTVEITYTDKDDTTSTPDETTEKTTETIYTYALALKKVDEKGANLDGAVFTLPFYVKKTANSNGAYVYAFSTLPATFAAGDSADNYTNELTGGEIVVIGVESGTYAFTEKESPSGYNKISGPINVTAAKTGKTTTETITKYVKQDGSVTTTQENNTSTVTYTNDKYAVTDVTLAVNKAGSELPETGGMGTTVFYIFGSVLVIGAGIVLITRRRMNVQ